MLTLTLMDGHVRNVVNLNYDIYRVVQSDSASKRALSFDRYLTSFG